MLPIYQFKQNIKVLIDNRSFISSSRASHEISCFLRDGKAEESGKGRLAVASYKKASQGASSSRSRESFFCSPYRYVCRAGETSQVSRRRHVIFTHRVCLCWLLFDVLGCPLVLPRLRVWPYASRVPSRVFRLPRRVHITNTYAYMHRCAWCVPTFEHIRVYTMHNVLVLIREVIIDFGECPRSESNWATAIEWGNLIKFQLRDVPEMRSSDHHPLLVNTSQPDRNVTNNYAIRWSLCRATKLISGWSNRWLILFA